MSKFCTNCGKELEENTAICLNCGVIVENKYPNSNTNTKEQSKKGLPTWLIVLIVIASVIIMPIIFITIIAITAFSIIDNYEYENFIEENEIIQNGTLGGTLTGENLKITLTDALIYDSVGDENNKETAKEGKEFLIFIFDIENISDKKNYISSFSFEGYVDGYTTHSKYLFNEIGGIQILQTNLAPGMKTKGFIAYEVEKNWSEFEIHYNGLLEDEKLIFSVRREESQINTNSNISGA